MVRVKSQLTRTSAMVGRPNTGRHGLPSTTRRYSRLPIGVTVERQDASGGQDELQNFTSVVASALLRPPLTLALGPTPKLSVSLIPFFFSTWSSFQRVTFSVWFGQPRYPPACPIPRYFSRISSPVVSCSGFP